MPVQPLLPSARWSRVPVLLPRAKRLFVAVQLQRKEERNEAKSPIFPAPQPLSRPGIGHVIHSSSSSLNVVLLCQAGARRVRQEICATYMTRLESLFGLREDPGCLSMS